MYYAARHTMRIRALLLATVLGTSLLPASAGADPAVNHEQRVSINARNVSLGDLAAILADQTGINVTVDGAMTRTKATLRLEGVSLDTALRAIESSYGISGAWSNGVLHLGASDAIIRGYPTTGSIEEKTIRLRYAEAAFVVSTLQNTLPQGSIVIADPRTSSVIVKGTPDTVATAEQLISEIDSSRVGVRGGIVTQLLEVNNLRATDALSLLKYSVRPGDADSITASDRPNEIIATGSTDFIAQVAAVLANIDKPGKQVRFKVRVTDINPIDDTSNIGVLWGGAQAGSTTLIPGNASAFTPLLTKSLPLNAQLNFLKSEAKATILAEPDISTINNEKATLNIGEQYPITFFNPQTGQNQVQFINAGVDLTITPTIGNNGEITVTLDTDYSQILSFVGTYPIVGQRHVVNVMRVGSDETIVIAGLFQDITNETVQKVPVLGDIPILGLVFRNRTSSHTRDEIVFLITPHIIDDSDFHPAAAIPAEPK
jgi:type II secretory pathway component GspD/PulD (secretin)